MNRALVLILASLPVCDKDDAVDVVWHNDVCIQFDRWEQISQPSPCADNALSKIVEQQFVLHDFPEQTLAIPNAYGHEIRAGLRVVEARQANRSTMPRRIAMSHVGPGS